MMNRISSIVRRGVAATICILIPVICHLAPDARAAQNSVQVPTSSPLPGLTLVNDLNAAFQSFATLFSGASAPSAAGLGLSATSGLIWHDTSTNTIKIRDQADANWIVLFGIDETAKTGTANAPMLASAAGQTVSGTNHYAGFVATAAATYTLAHTTNLWNGFAFAVFAQGGNVTVAINGSDKLNNGPAGTGTVIPEGYAAELRTDGAGNWWARLERMQFGNASVASASTVDLCAQGAPAVTITGTTTISSFGATCQAGQTILVGFAGALQLTYNATSMILPGAANLVTAAGDSATVLALGSGNYQVTGYQRANGTAVNLAIPVAVSRNLSGSAPGSAKTGHWTADELVAESALGGLAYRGANLNLNFNGGGTGAGGMDTGATPTSGSLYIYAIFNPASAAWNTLGTTAGSGASIYGGANMPSGYSASALIWSGVTDGSGNLLGFHQLGNKIWLQTKGNVLNVASSPATSFTSVGLGTVVPANARTASGVCGSPGSAVPDLEIASDANAAAARICQAGTTSSTVDGFGIGMPFEDMPLLSAQTIYYKAGTGSGTAVRIDINAYQLAIGGL